MGAKKTTTAKAKPAAKAPAGKVAKKVATTKAPVTALPSPEKRPPESCRSSRSPHRPHGRRGFPRITRPPAACGSGSPRRAPAWRRSPTRRPSRARSSGAGSMARSRAETRPHGSKFTPRGAKSVWSKINCDRAEALIASGEMKAPGLSLVEQAKKDGRWDAAYEPPSRATVPDDLAAALAAEREGGGVLRQARRDESICRAVAGADREEGRDAREEDRRVRRDAGQGGADSPAPLIQRSEADRESQRQARAARRPAQLGWFEVWGPRRLCRRGKGREPFPGLSAGAAAWRARCPTSTRHSRTWSTPRARRPTR